MNIKLFTIFLGILFSQCISNTRLNEKQQINPIGYWKHNCEDITGRVNILENNNISLNVNFNQISVKGTYFKTDQPNFYTIKYTSEDVGRGGMSLDWMNFEKDSIVATIRIKDSTHAYINWLGFYNNKTKQREWTNGSDFHGPLVKCDY